MDLFSSETINHTCTVNGAEYVPSDTYTPHWDRIERRKRSRSKRRRRKGGGGRT